MKQLIPILIISLLHSCATSEVEPSVSKNYQLALLQPILKGLQAQWLEKMKAATRVDLQEKPLLDTSREAHILRWRESIEHLKNQSQLIQAQQVSKIVNNQVEYKTDYEHWQKADRWGYPFETLTQGGDCEDFALLKLESLVHLGWRREQFAVLIGHSNFQNPPESHAVLLATLNDGSQLILDSLEDPVEAPTEDHHFSPTYAVTDQQIFRVTKNPLP